MLYWFRTPPGVKVGRAALDEDAIRLIEQLNPGIEFDWTRILKGQGTPSTESRPPVDVRRQRPDRRPPQSHQTPAPSAAVPPSVAVVPVQVRETSEAAAEPDSSDLSAFAGPTDAFSQVTVPLERAVPTPAHAKLGAEGVERLRARYAEILTRISERAADPRRREELKVQADRLNPDSWVTSEEVVQGLEQYESVFASLREVVGQKRRRRRRGSRPRPDEPGGTSGDRSDSSAVEASGGPAAGESDDSLPNSVKDTENSDQNDDSADGAGEPTPEE